MAAVSNESNTYTVSQPLTRILEVAGIRTSPTTKDLFVMVLFVCDFDGNGLVVAVVDVTPLLSRDGVTARMAI